jgi:serine-type D-Ala-D-Ala endopeptidase (penicillin-binding protein 7)
MPRNLNFSRATEVIAKRFFCIWTVSAVCFTFAGVLPSEAAAKASTAKRAKSQTAATTPAKGATKTASGKTASGKTTSGDTTSSNGTAGKTGLYRPAQPLTARTRLARARANAMAREVASTVLPRYRVDADGDLVPDLRAEAAIIYSPETKQVLWEQNSQTQRSIASITKVMTATVFLEDNPDLSRVVTVERSDVFQASTSYLRTRDQLTLDAVLHLMLIASDNSAARVLARTSPYGYSGFIARMNEKAAELGLENTHYADPSGLLSDNVSSAYDMACLITHASEDERISSVMRTPSYEVRVGRRNIAIHTTNRLLGREDVDVRAGKTGFISKSGYCLATLLRIPQSDERFAVVVLGARSNAGRFLETQNLFKWLSSRTPTIFATMTPAVPAQ